MSENFEKTIENKVLNILAHEWAEDFELDLPLNLAPSEKVQALKNKLFDLLDVEEMEDFTKELVIHYYKLGVKRGALELINIIRSQNMLRDSMEKLLPDEIKLERPIKYYRFNGQQAKIEKQVYSVSLGKKKK